MGDHDRLAGVAAGAQLGNEGNLPEQRHLELIGELLAAPLAEQAVLGAVIAEEPRHVLDDADHLEVDLARHVRGALSNLLRRRLRRGDDDDLRARKELRHRQRDVARARRHVDDEVVGLTPVDVGEELLEALCSIGPRQTTGWSSRAKNPIEISVTPFASGGTMTSSITVGGRSMPSMRGIENPQTSASMAATLRPRWARATARFVVTDDLPTPPLPEEIASTRVLESVKGLVRCS